MNRRIKTLMNEYVRTTPLNQWRDLKYVPNNNIQDSGDIVSNGQMTRRKHMKGSAVIAILIVCLVVIAIIIPVSIINNKVDVGREGNETKLDPTDKPIDIGNATYTLNGITYELYEDKTAAVISSSSLLVNANILEDVVMESVSYKVKEIASNSFKTSFIKTVVIPESIEKIGEYAFGSCKNLVEIVLPNSVVSIGKGCFINCNNLQNITLSKSMKTIEESAFKNCTAIETIDIPDSIQEIKQNAFNNCSSLVKIVIPDSVQEIKQNAFKDCFALVEIINKSDINMVCGDDGNGYIGYYALNIVANYNEGKVREENGFYLYENEDDIYLIKYVGTNPNVTIPNEITIIYNHAFANMLFIKEVTIPETVKRIGEKAFSYTCIGTLLIPDEVEFLGDNCFECCSLLKEAIIGEGVTIIPYECFNSCEDLKNVHIKGIVTEISESAFSSDYNLETIEINNGLITIGANAFSECYQLREIYLPNSLSEIGVDAFYNCYHLREIYNLSALNIELGASTYGGIALNALYIYHSKDVESKIFILDDGLQIVVDDNIDFYAVVGYYGNRTMPSLPNDIMGHDYILYDYALYTIPYFNSYEFYEYQALNGFITDLDYVERTEFVIPTGCIGINKYACNEYYANIRIDSGVTYIHGLAFYGTQLSNIVFDEPSDWYIIGGVSEVYFREKIFNINDIVSIEHEEYEIDVATEAFVELLTKKDIIGVWYQGRMVIIGNRKEAVFIKK